jgi:hypothetical protein
MLRCGRGGSQRRLRADCPGKIKAGDAEKDKGDCLEWELYMERKEESLPDCRPWRGHFPDFCHDLRCQPGRGFNIWEGSQVPYRQFQIGNRPPAGPATSQVPLDLRLLLGGYSIVQVVRKLPTHLRMFHHSSPTARFMHSLTISRARKSRDFTVPSRTLRMAHIST